MQCAASHRFEQHSLPVPQAALPGLQTGVIAGPQVPFRHTPVQQSSLHWLPCAAHAAAQLNLPALVAEQIPVQHCVPALHAAPLGSHASFGLPHTPALHWPSQHSPFEAHFAPSAAHTARHTLRPLPSSPQEPVQHALAPLQISPRAKH